MIQVIGERLFVSDALALMSTASNVFAAAHHDKRKRSLEVEAQFGGDHKAWLEHTWRIEKRTFHHEELHARWWSGDVRKWFDKQKKIDQEYTGVRHRIAVSSESKCAYR
jgi:hypothetical protein